MDIRSMLAWGCLATPMLALAQPGPVKPPVAQAWIDVATFSGLGVPGLGGGAAPNPMTMLGGLLGRGGSGGGNAFGRTQSMSAGRWVDVTLRTSLNPTLGEAEQAVPAGFLSPALKLVAPRDAKAPPPTTGADDPVQEPTYERPRGRMLLYWGCGPTIRPGQPKVLDLATASPSDMAQFFQVRNARQQGTHAAAGRPVWPNPDDARMVPAEASLVGEHAFRGSGVPEGFRFQIPAAQDLMPPLQVQQAGEGQATTLVWTALPTARGYFIAGMGGSQGAGSADVILWTSSEVPETGFALVDYQTNAAVDRWIGEKVLLARGTTRCTVPAGVFPGGQAMLRMVAYGSELNLAHPPRPADPRATWEPQWAVKVRVKSVTQLMLGVDMPAMGGTTPASPSGEPPAAKKEESAPKPLEVLRGLFGR